MIEWLEAQISEYMDCYISARANHNHKQMEIEWAKVESFQRTLDELRVRIHNGEISLTIDF
jgi:hypothetical protein